MDICLDKVLISLPIFVRVFSLAMFRELEGIELGQMSRELLRLMIISVCHSLVLLMVHFSCHVNG